MEERLKEAQRIDALAKSLVTDPAVDPAAPAHVGPGPHEVSALTTALYKSATHLGLSFMGHQGSTGDGESSTNSDKDSSVTKKKVNPNQEGLRDETIDLALVSGVMGPVIESTSNVVNLCVSVCGAGSNACGSSRKRAYRAAISLTQPLVIACSAAIKKDPTALRHAVGKIWEACKSAPALLVHPLHAVAEDCAECGATVNDVYKELGCTESADENGTSNDDGGACEDKEKGGEEEVTVARLVSMAYKVASATTISLMGAQRSVAGEASRSTSSEKGTKGDIDRILVGDLDSVTKLAKEVEIAVDDVVVEAEMSRPGRNESANNNKNAAQDGKEDVDDENDDNDDDNDDDDDGFFFFGDEDDDGQEWDMDEYQKGKASDGTTTAALIISEHDSCLKSALHTLDVLVNLTAMTRTIVSKCTVADDTGAKIVEEGHRMLSTVEDEVESMRKFLWGVEKSK